MADIQIISSRQVRQPIDFVTGRLASPTRVLAIPPTVEHAALVSGDQYLQLPEWSVDDGGPMMFQMQGADGGSNLVGMGGSLTAAIAEYSLLGALIAIICSAGIVTTSADDEGAPEGSRFSAAVQINAGYAQLFLCASVGGVKKWFPVGFATPSP